jgi:hypothetical protein
MTASAAVSEDKGLYFNPAVVETSDAPIEAAVFASHKETR